jgi:hypothetical protein
MRASSFSSKEDGRVEHGHDEKYAWGIALPMPKSY